MYCSRQVVFQRKLLHLFAGQPNFSPDDNTSSYSQLAIPDYRTTQSNVQTECEFLFPSDCLACGAYIMNKENAAIWVIPQCLNSDNGELPTRKRTTFKTRRKFQIKKNAATLPNAIINFISSHSSWSPTSPLFCDASVYECVCQLLTII